MRCFDEEITKDFFFSPNLLPLLTVSLSRPLLGADWTLPLKETLEGDAALLLLVSSGPEVTARGIRARGPGGNRLSQNQKSLRAPRCTAHLRLAGSGQFEFMPPPELLRWLHTRCGALDLVTGAA